ncbi:hypothetical protein SDC9_210120 [bioreactor metagenome]|uniref:Uncharacterized protein n=1 Tax=bioreactor metagenome TaxID=1076179 RepID=A0A645JSN5_9ZZZZ
MPLSPVSKRPQLYIRNERILPVPLPDRLDGFCVGFDQDRVLIVRAVSLSIRNIVSFPVFSRLLPKPVRNIPVLFVSGQVQDKAEKDPLAFLPPFVKMMLIFK